ncbi:MAG: TonB-dependent receptor [Steroidobacteraceae bacterium]|jgi:iron complex outermembrane receptor protein|nr:TonB-dependent receptor [Steroidobacteraceae bacterium]
MGASTALQRFSSLSLPALVVAGAGLWAIPPAARAQDAATQGPVLEEIVVSARKREESLIDVPLAISVLSAKDLDARQITELDDIAAFSPGFFYGGPSVGANARNNRRMIIRGMQFNTDVQTKQGATLFIDGAPVTGAEFGRLRGIERVEVIKGPQSAYFGRSTFAGAINIITRRPRNEWGGEVYADIGQYGWQDLGATLEGPVFSESVAFRLDLSDYSQDGQYRNAGGRGERLGERQTRDAALTFLATPSDDFSAKLRMHYWEDEDGPPPGFTFASGNAQDAFNCNRGGNSPVVNGMNNWICGVPRQPTRGEISLDTVVTPDVALRLANGSPGQIALLGSWLDGYGLKRKAHEISLFLDYQFANGWSLSSISAWHDNKHRTVDDLDRRATESRGLARNWVQIGDNVREDFSQELRLTSSQEGRFTWLVGANYNDITAKTVATTRLLGTWTSGQGISTNAVETIGLFGAAAYKFTDRWILNVEGRYQEDKVTDGVQLGATLSDTFVSETPRVILEYKPADNQTFYASFSQGTRPGSFNPNVVGLPSSVLSCLLAEAGADTAVPEEELDSYELGFKGRLFDDRLQLTAAVYSAEWRKQNNRGGPLCRFPDGTTQTVFVTGTGGATDLRGVELEMQFAATERLTLEATFAWNDSEILTRDCADCLGILGVREIAGLRKEFSRTPIVSGTASADYRGSFGNGMSWFARGDYIFRGSTWATEANVAETGDQQLVNLRLGLERDAWRLEAYVNNALDNDTFSGFQRFTDGSVSATAVMMTAGLAEKRTVGVRASYRFGER